MQRIHQFALGAVDQLALFQRARQLFSSCAELLHAQTAVRQRFQTLHQRILAEGIMQHDDVLGFLALIILRNDHHHIGGLSQPTGQLLSGHIRQSVRRQQQRAVLRRADGFIPRMHNTAGNNLRGREHVAQLGGHALRRGDIKAVGK